MSQQSVPAPETPESIFIHSLFRAGSTYLFKVFRRGAGYWCYQEPLHEWPLLCKEDKERLLETSQETATLLRHPHLDRPYFFELYEVADACLPHLQKKYIYDGYFCEEGEDTGLPFFRALIAAAKARPVIQECRTSMRIKALKEALGGVHLFLWRNPWDQWWSYKVDGYFDRTSQLFINGECIPEVIARLRREIVFSEFENDDLGKQFIWFMNHRLAPEENYLLFYTLWILALQHGVKNADILINIDRLSCDAKYRQQVADMLAEKGITGLDFSDCRVPQARYGKTDAAFFQKIEDKAHGLLLCAGTPQKELDSLLHARRSFEPEIRRNESPTANEQALLHDAERIRAVVRQVEEREACAQGAWHEAETRVQHEEERVRQLDEEARRISERLQASEQRFAETEARARQEEQRAAQAEAKARQVEQRALQADAKAQQEEQRAAQAEAKAQQEEQRAVQAEVRTRQEEQRVSEAGERVRQLDEEASQISERLQASEQRAVQVEARALHEEARAVDAETRIASLFHSRSWRITMPLRGVQRLLHGDPWPIIAVKNGLIGWLRPSARRQAAALSVLPNAPGADAACALEAKTQPAALAMSPDAAQASSSEVVALDELSPRAVSIYYKLKRASERHRKEDS